MAVKHINITLPEQLIERVNKIAEREHVSRSGLIKISLSAYIASLQQKRLKEMLKKGYLEMAEESRKISDEWLPLEKESLRNIGDNLVDWGED